MGNNAFCVTMKSADIRHFLIIIPTTHTIQLSAHAYFFDSQWTRVTARTVEIAKDTVTDALRSIEGLLWYVNYDYLNSRRKGDMRVEIVRDNEAAMDEMRSFVGGQSHQYWLWRGIDHTTGEPLAFYFCPGKHENLDKLLGLQAVFAIKIVYTDYN
jgi:hypothetical protein